jgi:hypothetical protein
MKIFKVEAEDDTLYIEAANFQAASDRLEKFMGIIPESLLKWSEAKELPEGEELL